MQFGTGAAAAALEGRTRPDLTIVGGLAVGQVIALANQKGGVAKTTTTLNLGVALVERGKRVLCVDLDPQSNLTGASGDSCRDVQDPVSERFDLAARQIGMLGEADEFGPGHQICCRQDDFQPGRVRLGAVTGQVGQPGGLGLTDPVLHPGVLAVAQFEPAELAGDHAGWGVGDERGHSQPVGIGEPQLRSGMRAFLTQDQPGSGRPAAQVHQVGGFGDPGAVTDGAAVLDRRIPAVGGVEDFHRILHAGIHGVAEGEPHPPRAARLGEVVGGAGRIAAHQNLLRAGVVGVGGR